MKCKYKVIFILSLICAPLLLGAQEGLIKFKYKESINGDPIIGFVELNDNTLIIASNPSLTLDSTKGDFTHVIIVRKVTMNGDIIKEIKYQSDSLAYGAYSFMIPSDSSGYLILGVAVSLDVKGKIVNRYYFTLTLSNELKLINQNLFLREDYVFINKMQSHWVNDSIIISTAKVSKFDKYPLGMTALLLINKNGKFKKVKYLYDEKIPIADVIPSINGNGFVGFGEKVYIFNDTFKLIAKQYQQDWKSTRQGDVILKQNESYLFTFHFGGFKIGLYEYDQDLQIVKQRLDIGEAYPPWLFPIRRALDYTDEEKIYLGGKNGESFIGMVITQLNSKLETNWVKYFRPKIDGNEVAYYPNLIVASKYGGCYCAGSLDYRDKNNVRQKFGYILHVNDRGEIVSTKEAPKMKLDLTVYPNPSLGEFRMNLKGELRKGTIKFVDMLGKEVIKESFRSGENVYNFPTLSSGLYNYTLYDNDGLIIGQGKWVKK